jgi:hypothetical protein
MEHKLSKAQIEAKTYVETHKLEKIIGDMLNALVYAKDPHPTVFMIKYLASLAGPSELQENGIIIGSQALQHPSPKTLKNPKKPKFSQPKSKTTLSQCQFFPTILNPSSKNTCPSQYGTNFVIKKPSSIMTFMNV